MKGGISYGIIKRYYHVSPQASDLQVVSTNGVLLGKLIYSRTASVHCKYITMSTKGQRSKFMNTQETIELEEVVIYPPGGGAPYIPIIFPPAPVSTPPSPGGVAYPDGAVADEAEPSDGGWGQSNFYWNIQKMTMPTKAAFLEAYPKPGVVTSTELYIQIGWSLKDAAIANPTAYANTCVIRICKALNACGKLIPEADGKTLKGADGKNYLVKIADLEVFMKEAFPAPSYSNTNFPTPDQIKFALDRSAGIAILKAAYPGDSGFRATGHASVVDNKADLETHKYKAKGGVHTFNIWSFGN